MKKTITYQQAVDELEKLVAEMETGKGSLDELTEKVRKAGELVKICKQKLRESEKTVGALLDEFEA